MNTRFKFTVTDEFDSTKHECCGCMLMEDICRAMCMFYDEGTGAERVTDLMTGQAGLKVVKVEMKRDRGLLNSDKFMYLESPPVEEKGFRFLRNGEVEE